MSPIAMPLSLKKRANSDDQIVFLLIFVPVPHSHTYISGMSHFFKISSKTLRNKTIHILQCISVQKEGILFISILLTAQLGHNAGCKITKGQQPALNCTTVGKHNAAGGGALHKNRGTGSSPVVLSAALASAVGTMNGGHNRKAETIKGHRTAVKNWS